MEHWPRCQGPTCAAGGWSRLQAWMWGSHAKQRHAMMLCHNTRDAAVEVEERLLGVLCTRFGEPHGLSMHRSARERLYCRLRGRYSVQACLCSGLVNGNM